MPVALDFGTSNTVIARWDPAADDVVLLETPELSRQFEYVLPDGSPPGVVTVYPSLIHYGDRQQPLAAQVEDAGLVEDPATFRWLKMDMLRQNRRCRRLGRERISYEQAATEFVSRLLLFVSRGGELLEDDLVVSVPVEAYDHYVEWLTRAVATVYDGNIHLIDEATACILGYDRRARDGDLFLVVDFGGGTLDVCLVRADFSAADQVARSRLLGRAGEEIGGMMVDQWLLAEIPLSEDDLRLAGQDLLRAVEAAKIQLTYEAQASVSHYAEGVDRLITHTFTRTQLREILDRNQFFKIITDTVDRAVEQATEKYGVKRSEIHEVLLVGGTSLIPAVQEQFAYLFPNRIRCDNPFAAIAAGACRFVEQSFNPAVVHDYCLRSWNAENRDWDFAAVIPKGTRYPTERPVKTVFLNATHDEQDRLGLLLYELSDMLRVTGGFVVGSDGRLQRAAPGAVDRQQPLNPENREFIVADPPCRKGERRFAAAFGVDARKRLTVSLRDLREGNRSRILPVDGDPVPLPVEDFPVTRLGH